MEEEELDYDVDNVQEGDTVMGEEGEEEATGEEVEDQTAEEGGGEKKTLEEERRDNTIHQMRARRWFRRWKEVVRALKQTERGKEPGGEEETEEEAPDKEEAPAPLVGPTLKEKVDKMADGLDRGQNVAEAEGRLTKEVIHSLKRKKEGKQKAEKETLELGEDLESLLQEYGETQYRRETKVTGGKGAQVSVVVVRALKKDPRLLQLNKVHKTMQGIICTVEFPWNCVGCAGWMRAEKMQEGMIPRFTNHTPAQRALDGQCECDRDRAATLEYRRLAAGPGVGNGHGGVGERGGMHKRQARGTEAGGAMTGDATGGAALGHVAGEAAFPPAAPPSRWCRYATHSKEVPAHAAQVAASPM